MASLQYKDVRKKKNRTKQWKQYYLDPEGAKASNLFGTLEKINSQRLNGKANSEDLQQLRFTTNKLLHFITAQDKNGKDLTVKNGTNIDIVLTTLDTANDSNVEQNCIYIINELLGKTHTGKRANLLVGHGATQVLLHVLVSESKEQNPSEELLISIHSILAKLGPKDRKLAVKARLSQALQVTLNLIRNHSSSLKLLQPVVHVLKLYAANAVNASYLGKSGAVSYIFKILAMCGKKHLTLLKYTLDTLALLVKSKSNSARAIGQGGVPILLTSFLDWHRLDTKNKHIALRKSFLNVLKHITNLKSGRKALMDADGIRILYNTCQETIECRELEGIIFVASIIMRKCFPKNRLPLHSLRSSLSCQLPESDFHVLESVIIPTGSEDGSLSDGIQRTNSAEDNGYESSIDNDDDISSDEDPEARKIESEDDAEAVAAQEAPDRRSPEDLQMYETFFPELLEFESALDDDVDSGRETGSIYVPTGSSDTNLSFHGRRSARASQSATGVESERQEASGAPRLVANRRSMPNLTNYCSRDDDLAIGLRGLKMAAGNSDMDTICESSLPGSARLRNIHGLFASGAPNGASPSAINVHSGTNVFALNLSPKTAHPRNSSKSKQKGTKGSKSASKENSRRKTKNRSEDILSSSSALSSSLSITPVAISPRGACDSMDLDSESDQASDDYASIYEEIELYKVLHRKTHSIGRFNKIAYPELAGHRPPPYQEPLCEKKFGVQRAKIFQDIDRMINPEQVIDRVVYDLDASVSAAGPCYTSQYSTHINRDEIRVTLKDDFGEHLKFNSQFESGNLRKVVQIRPYEYDLILSPDVNTNHHHQWFYFEVSNMKAGIKYRLNIVNCEKLNSQFNFGMQPLLFSVKESIEGRPHWTRTGSEICYYKNHFTRSSQTTGGVRGKTYYTATFTIMFPHNNDVCYMAYHYPYTYTTLQANISKFEEQIDRDSIYFRNQSLCETIAGNPVPVLTITSYPHSYDREGLEQFRNRPYMFLSARVHPGESNSSWVMKGTIQYLLSDKPQAQALRDTYIFKIVPMLNPDGVIHGNHRCSLVAEDLNRRWMHPCPKLHPTIYHTKGLLQYLHMIGRSPLVFCDYHGHSRRKNVFLYGCSPSLSWLSEDLNNPAMTGNKMEDTGFKTLPRILHACAPAFSLNNCSFMVEKSKESTARVVVWRQIGVVRSYTMESSYCGCDQGPYKGNHLSTRELEEMGRKFCDALLRVKSRHVKGAPPASALSQQLPSISDSLTHFDDGDGLSGACAPTGQDEVIPITLESESSSGTDQSDSENSMDGEEEPVY